MVLNPGGRRVRRRRRRGRNAWAGDRRGHCRAAKKGWRTRRRKKRKARKARSMSKARRSAAAKKGHRRRRAKRRLYTRFAGPQRNNPPRRRRRRRRRARNYSHWIPAYKNPRRKAKRRVRYNYKAKRRRRKKARNYSHWIPAYKNPQWIPNYAMNPRGGILGSVTQGFQPKTIMDTVPYVGGAIGNAALQSAVSGFLPSMLQEGPGSYVTGLATAGLLGAGVGMVSPRMAAPVFMGGVIEQVLRAFSEYVGPAIGMSGCCGMGFNESSYANLEWGNPLVESQPLITKSYLAPFQKVTGLNPWAKVGGMGDYLTRYNAAEARPLGAYTYSDLPMEEATVQELSD